MAFSYLTPQNIAKTFKDSEKSMLSLFDPVEEYERIARNRPHPNIDRAYPKTTDGTLASIIQETPKRYIQQLPTGVVETSEGEWFDVYANWKLVEDIIPLANCQADALQKSWRAGSNSMTYGSQPSYVFMDNYNGDLKANFKLPYITHVYLQKGKVSAKDSNVIFMEAWYQESDIDEIIDKEKQRKQDEGKDYTQEWDIKALEEYKKRREAKNEDQKNPQERKDKEEMTDDGIRIIHAFQKGIGAKFYSFIPESGESGEESSTTIIRTRVNKDPRGVIPIHYLYCNIDFYNPIGRGIIEISGGMQNLLDSLTQSFQYMQALSMNPPMVASEDWPKGSIKFVPNAIMRKPGQSSTLEPLTINSQAISNFPTTYGLIKSQILNLNNSADTSVSAEVGNPGFSKTDAGVNALQARLGVSDNYLRKQYESWWEENCETMLNLTFAEIDGLVEEVLDKKTADKLQKLIPEGNEYVTWKDEKTIIVNYDLLGVEPIYFHVDASSSEVKQDQTQVESLNAAKELVIDMLPVSKRMALANKFIYKLGIEDPEDITFSETELAEAVQAEQQANQPDQTQQNQPALTQDEMELAQGLAQRGVPEQAIMQAVSLFREGMPVEQIVQVVMQPQTQGAM